VCGEGVRGGCARRVCEEGEGFEKKKKIINRIKKKKNEHHPEKKKGLSL
jgi:hypothetical protein